jgi:hypothetical protein
MTVPATGSHAHTQAELEALLLILEDAVPHVPSKKDKKGAGHVATILSGRERNCRRS